MPRPSRLLLVAAVALAAADSAIVVLALPQLLSRFNGTIPATAWVVTAYNLAAAVAGGFVLLGGARLRSRPLLLAGLAVFAAASIGCAAAASLPVLVAFRAVQGVGGGFVLAGALAELGPASWAGAAALGAAVGPSLGGALTQAFEWRAIFIGQAPVALAAVAGAIRARSVVLTSGTRKELRSSLSLALVSGALVGALFLAVVLLVEGLGLSPLGAAGVVSIVPACAIAARRMLPELPIATGVLALAGGLAMLGALPQDSLTAVAAALVVCGAGLGLSLPAFGERAGLPGVSARHAGVVVGLLLTAPVLAHDLSRNAAYAKLRGVVLVAKAPLPLLDKVPLGVDLFRTVESTDHGRLPDFEPAFTRAHERDGAAAGELDALQHDLNRLERDAVSSAFGRPFDLAAVLALVALLPLVGRRFLTRVETAQS